MAEIYQLGLTQLFVEIVLVVIKTFKIDLKDIQRIIYAEV